MANSQLYSIEGKENAVIRQICKVDVTTTTVANDEFSAYLAFSRAYAVAPSVTGINAPRAGAIAGAEVSTTGITVHVRGLSDAVLADGTLQVTATVEGRLA
jgi:hypothetical protein